MNLDLNLLLAVVLQAEVLAIALLNRRATRRRDVELREFKDSIRPPIVFADDEDDQTTPVRGKKRKT